MEELNLFRINEARCLRLIRNAITTFALDLSGLVVLTEAATGYYILTPMIAALAGANHVYALTRDSRYGTAKVVGEKTMALADRWGIGDRIEIVSSREDERIGLADIVTNLGFVRPLNKAFLKRLKHTTVIPLMFETWEYRSEDVDLAECRRLNIPLLGTNEHHPNLRIFGYIGPVALKILFRLGIEVFRSSVVVIGSGEFAAETLKTLHATGAEVTLLSPQVKGALNSGKACQAFRQADSVVVVEHHDRGMLIGSYGEIDTEELYALNPGLTVAHICGGVDRVALEAVGLRCYPEKLAPTGYMSVATDYVGPRPMIDLHTAGLKVGERLALTRAQGLPALEAEFTVLRETSLAQGFAGYHDIDDLRA